MSALDEVTEVIAGVAAAVGGSVVGVNRHGTGVVIRNGIIATNAHNLRSEEVYVTFADGRTATGTAAGVDIDGDLAVIAVETAEAAGVEWTGSTVNVGEVVVALSNPRGRGLRATIGTVSSTGRGFRGPRGRRIPGSLEHTAPLARGSSGGPVLDRTGKLVGLNTNRLQEGFYQALTANDELRESDRSARSRKGPAPAPPRDGDRPLPRGAAPSLGGRAAGGRRASRARSRGGRSRRQSRASARRRPRRRRWSRAAIPRRPVRGARRRRAGAPVPRGACRRRDRRHCQLRRLR